MPKNLPFAFCLVLRRSGVRLVMLSSIGFGKRYYVNYSFYFTLIFSFTLVTVIPNYFYYSFLVGSISVGFLYLVLQRESLDRKLFLYLLSALTPSAIGMIGYFAGLTFESDVFNYDHLNPFGRILNLILLFMFILFLHAYQKGNHILKAFDYYYFGTFILLATAVWQVISAYTGYIPFPFETRSHLHSAGDLQLGFGTRITGIAEEPSYFAMFAIDFFALSFLLIVGAKRGLLIALALCLLLLSLSPSGYITFALAFVGSCVFTSVKFVRAKKVATVGKIFLVVAFIFVMPGFAFVIFKYGFMDYILVRLGDPAIFESPRVYMNYMPFVWASDSSVISILFGHGVKSYSIIGSAFDLPNGEPVHVTSNNLYVDVFWESGFLGLVALLGFFGHALYGILKSSYSKLQIFVALFVFFDLLFSSLFRADFASLRFFVLIYLLFVLTNYNVYAKDK